MFRAAVLGASGFVGGELLRLLDGHPHIRSERLFAHSQAGQTIASAHPQLALAERDRTFESFGPGALDGCDFILAALPHGETQRLADMLLAPGIPIVDLGADFRLNSADEYQRWYGEPHLRPDLIDSFVYGLPEFFRARIRESQRVAAPGCYPTAANLALRPLRAAGVIEPQGIVVDAVSGVSGAGRAASEATHFCSVSENFRAYGLLGHRHTAEMEMLLEADVLFTPHLAPMNRGLLATCYARAAGPCDPLALLRDAYAQEPFVHVGEASPETRWASGSNAAFVTARYDERTGTVVALAAIDNLGKGAAGQMVQCANLMLGLDETAGLSTIGQCP